MPHAAQLDRMLDREVINLGFPGMAMLEPEMAEAIADQPASLFILDPVPNNSPQQVVDNLPRFVEIIRDRHPDTPILLVQDRRFENEHCTPHYAQEMAKNSALDQAMVQLRT